MIFRNCDMKEFSKRCKDNDIVCYGIGGEFDRIIQSYYNYEWIENVYMLVDGDPHKRNQKICINNRIYTIENLEKLKAELTSKMIIFITSTAYYEIALMLNSISNFDNTECYLFHFMFALGEEDYYSISQTNQAIIPPVIHYCWFGGKTLPDVYKKYIDTWHKFCPNYEIKEWNESNCDIEETLYTSQAYKVGKYGFVPDYFRLKIIYEQGGIYLDTDVEVLKNLDDLRYNDAFCGVEFPGEVALGLGFGACKGNICIKKMMERYINMSFINEDGSINEIASPIYQSKDLIKMGMTKQNIIQNIEGMTIYPIEVLSPQNVYTGTTSISRNTYMWHHFDGSWVSGDRLEKKRRRLEQSMEIYKLICESDRKELIIER